MVVAPSRKLIVPVGVGVADTWVTVAVNVTDWPYEDGFSDDVTVVVVSAVSTVIVGLVSVLAVSARSAAVTVCVPTVFSVTLNVFVPATSGALPGNAAAPSVEVI